MAYKVLQKRRFIRQYKKLHSNVIEDVDKAVAQIAKTPTIGERKKVIYRAFLFISFTVKLNSIFSDILLKIVYTLSI